MCPGRLLGLGAGGRRNADHGLPDEDGIADIEALSGVLVGEKVIGLRFLNCRSGFVVTILVFLVSRGAFKLAVRVVGIPPPWKRSAPPVGTGIVVALSGEGRAIAPDRVLGIAEIPGDNVNNLGGTFTVSLILQLKAKEKVVSKSARKSYSLAL